MPKVTFRVLVVDDNCDSADSLVLAIRGMGHDAVSAYDPITALELAEKYQPQVLLLDILMPGMTGYELAGKLRDVVDFSQAVLVGITGLSEDCYRHKGWDAGFSYFLIKPIDPNRLRQLINDLSNNMRFPIQLKPSYLVELESRRRLTPL